MGSERKLLTVAQAAKRVRHSRRTIERWIASGDLPVTWWSNIRYVNINDLLTVYRTRLIKEHQHWTAEQIAQHLAEKYLPARSTHRDS